MQNAGAMRTLILAACAVAAGCSGSGSSGRDGGGTGAAGNSGGAGTTGTAGTTGAGGTSGGGGSGGNGSSFEPMSVGATWTYNTTDVGDGGVGTVSGTKVVTVEASEAVPMRAGITAWRIFTHVPGTEEQLTWQAETSTAIVRYRDEVFASGAPRTCTSISASGCTQSSTYAPSKLRIDTTSPHLATGATYNESYTETDTDATGVSSSSKPFGWKVINAAESVTVPAGTFTAVHLQKSNGNSGAIDKDYWFVLGVGKIKETSSAGREELLASFNIP
jgi:hypothetical protein